MAFTITHPKAHIHQIFYDEATRFALEPHYIPLDNSHSQAPDWYECWPMVKALSVMSLNDTDWYGFVSPKFGSKVGFNSEQVLALLGQLPSDCEVALFSPGWDQLAYFKNPWEQGEIWHPGLMNAFSQFLTHLQIHLDLNNLVTDQLTSVFCNFVIAKASYWKQWLPLAKSMMDFYDQPEVLSGDGMVPYGQLHRRISLKAFLQERLSSLILLSHSFNVASCTYQKSNVFKRLFPRGNDDRGMLHLCEQFKQEFRKTREPSFIKAYEMARQSIPFIHPYGISH